MSIRVQEAPNVPGSTLTPSRDLNGEKLPIVGEPDATTSSVTEVNADTTVKTLLAQNIDRIGATVFNNSPATLYVKLGAGASLTSWSAKLYEDGQWPVPPSYKGVVTGIWQATGGEAHMSEWPA